MADVDNQDVVLEVDSGGETSEAVGLELEPYSADVSSTLLGVRCESTATQGGFGTDVSGTRKERREQRARQNAQLMTAPNGTLLDSLDNLCQAAPCLIAWTICAAVLLCLDMSC